MNQNNTLSVDFWSKVEDFTTLLLKYNQTHNITGAKTKDAVLANVKDSIEPLEFLDVTHVKEAIDIGTGAGFPGLLLALALPDVHFTLFEPIAKKSAFLHLSKTALKMDNVDVCTNRVEKITPWSVELITSRAVTNTKMLINLCQGYIQPSTTLLFTKERWLKRRLKALSVEKSLKKANATIL